MDTDTKTETPSAKATLSPIVKQLISEYNKEVTVVRSGIGYNVSRTVSTLAVMFEKIRNAVEFRADHLIRRAAIERILKRRIMLQGSASAIAEALATELLWARYIDSSIIDANKISELTFIIDKYLTIKQMISAGHADIPWDYVLGVASSELDEAMIPATKRQALLFFFYQTVRSKISLAGVDAQLTNLITLISSERAYMQSDDALISFHVSTLLIPDWTKNKTPVSTELAKQFIDSAKTIRNTLTHPATAAVFRYLRKHIPPFLLIRDLFAETAPTDLQNIIESPKTLEDKLTEIAIHKYNETGQKVRRAMVRSFIYIFLTKMVFALALEAPYDIYILHKLAVIPLVVNTLFPPVMLFLVAGLFSVPGADNTRRLVQRIQTIFYHFDETQKEKDTFAEKQRVRRPILSAGFSVIYFLTFIITFGLINIGLSALEFSIPSKIIFVFFVALVSFFAYRIRQSAKEYEMIERQGLLEPIMDFFLMPILQAGQFLSREIAKINIFIFIFDFILEAPLKTIFELVEEWIRFVRIKKEEII